MQADVTMESCSFDGEMYANGGRPKEECPMTDVDCMNEDSTYGVAAYVFQVQKPETYEQFIFESTSLSFLGFSPDLDKKNVSYWINYVNDDQIE